MSDLVMLTQSGKVWRLNEAQSSVAFISTGFTELDQALAGGWPQHTVIDLQSQTGIGELRLLVPLLQHQQQYGKLLVFISPPARLSSQMLAQAGIQLTQVLVLQPKNAKEAFWAAEICLKSGCCSIVLQWQSQLSVTQLKRLQLSAEQGQASHILLRPLQQQLALPVALSLQLMPSPVGLTIHIVKRRGGRPRAQTELNWQQHYPELCLPAEEKQYLQNSGGYNNPKDNNTIQNHSLKVAERPAQLYSAEFLTTPNNETAQHAAVFSQTA